MALVTGNSPIAKEISDALGLKNARSLKLSMSVDSIVMIEVESFVENEKLKKLIPIFKKYELKEIE